MPQMSLRSLVIAGFGLSVLPGVLTVLITFLALEQFADFSKQTAYRVAEISEKTQALRERLIANERKGKQLVVLKDPTLGESYRLSHRQLSQIVSQLGHQADDEALRNTLQEFLSAQDALLQEIERAVFLPPMGSADLTRVPVKTASPTPTTATHVPSRHDDLFEKLDQLGEKISEMAADSIDHMVADLESEAARVQTRILWTASILVPISLVLVGIFIHLITYPIRQLDHAIRQLGTGNLNDAISVSGPNDLRYLGQRLDWLRDQLKTLERSKHQFVRNVSHELKTPLANIHEGATLLADKIVGEVNSEQQGIIDIMLNNTTRLEHLISELIHYGSASGTRERNRPQRVDMREIVRSVIADYELGLRSKSIKLRQRLQASTLSGNRGQLRLVVDNLMSNAVKYTAEGGTIEVSLAEHEGYVELEFRDEGPGVRSEERDLIFEPFYRSLAARAAGVKGSGLGLAIVRECVAGHQGKIEVSDAHDGRPGARFRVRLPIDPQV